MIIYQNPDGTYKLSTPDAEASKIVSKEKGLTILREMKIPKYIIDAKRPNGGFVVV